MTVSDLIGQLRTAQFNAAFYTNEVHRLMNLLVLAVPMPLDADVGALLDRDDPPADEPRDQG